MPSTSTVTGTFSADWVAVSSFAIGASSRIVIVSVLVSESPSTSATVTGNETEVVSPVVLSVRVKE